LATLSLNEQKVKPIVFIWTNSKFDELKQRFWIVIVSFEILEQKLWQLNVLNNNKHKTTTITITNKSRWRLLWARTRRPTVRWTPATTTLASNLPLKEKNFAKPEIVETESHSLRPLFRLNFALSYNFVYKENYY
jgi:hypothetical protein